MAAAAAAAAAPGPGRTAAVLGATGAVGGEVVKALLARGWASVVVLNRREVDTFSGDSKVKQHVVPMEDGRPGGPLETACTDVLKSEGADAVFVTMGVGAPSKSDADTLVRVDVTLPTACARGAKAAGVRHVSLLTAVGADASAVPATSDRLFGLIPRTHAGGGLYNQCKGRVEDNIRALAFPSFSTFRPATLLGTPHTPTSVAVIGRAIDFMLPAKYKNSPISTLATAMVLDAEEKLSADPPSQNAAFDVFEGKPLHNLYARTKPEAN